MRDIIFTVAKNDEDLKQILALQKLNYKAYISPEEAESQGFVSIEHDFPLLKDMNADYQHIIAKSDDKVIGFALVMLRKFGDEIDVLLPMFERINVLDWKEVSMADSSYFIMGQVCVAKGFRGLGVFSGLYTEMKERMKGDFDYLVTEVASRNIPSMRAHKKVGFELMLNYTIEGDEEWNIIILELKNT
ncbi:MAG: ribosomal protein S18 acetylase RimI-like enzyme [Saprospiraceae bacterium]|jgi:ribosomal protein S18 acetylase RimI-like enzyme